MRNLENISLPSNEAIRAIAHAERQRMPSRQSRAIVMGALLEALAAKDPPLLPKLANKNGAVQGAFELQMHIDTMLAQYESYRLDGGGGRDENIYKNLTDVFHRAGNILFDDHIVFNHDVGPSKNIVRAALAFENVAKPNKPQRPQNGNVYTLYRRPPFGLYMAANEVLSHCLQTIDKRWPALIDGVCDQNSRVSFYRNFCERNRNTYQKIGMLTDMPTGIITLLYEDMHDMVKDTADFIKNAANFLSPVTIGLNPHFCALQEICVFLHPYGKPLESPAQAEPRNNVVPIKGLRF